jgi:hypothetical protein
VKVRSGESVATAWRAGSSLPRKALSLAQKSSSESPPRSESRIVKSVPVAWSVRVIFIGYVQL